jgi:pantoate--beta-alanine ligase
MRVITTVKEMASVCPGWGSSSSIGLVPTMGYLHEGHLALVRRARIENDLVIVSIFVNPTQFGPHEDFERYPRDVDRDLYMLEAEGVDVVFTPSVDEMYPAGYVTYVEPGGPLVEQAEGKIRPGHFRGVATVVLKLFHIVQPRRAYFGQKDAQQVAVITRMVADLNLPLTLRIGSTVREPDGLAMSSRNVYLTSEQRQAARVLYRALQAGRRVFESHPEQGVAAVVQAMTETVAAEPLVRLDYAEVRDSHSFLPLEDLRAPALLLIAAYVGSVRLIDNTVLLADGTWDAGHQAEQIALDGRGGSAEAGPRPTIHRPDVNLQFSS